MNTTRNTTSRTDMMAMAIDHHQDCCRGLCQHPQCHSRLDRAIRNDDRRVESNRTPVAKKVTDAEVGFDIMATAMEYRSECARGICHHAECHRQVRRRIRRSRRNGRSSSEVRPSGNFVTVLTSDGFIDKRATREQRLFGAREELFA